jgi:hypothetical protein
MGPFPDKKLTRGVLKISIPAVAGDVRDHSRVLSLALGLIFGLPGYLFSCDITNFFSMMRISLPASFQNILILRYTYVQG